MQKTTTMDQLFLDEIRDLYDAEKQLTKALPKMAKAASSDDLRMAFEGHLEQTQGHVSRLEEIFDALGEKGTGKKCTAMQGLIKEGEESDGNGSERVAGCGPDRGGAEGGALRDFGLWVGANPRATHSGTLEAVSLLDETLNEEKEADRKLNDLAENTINNEAMEESGEVSGRRI